MDVDAAVAAAVGVASFKVVSPYCTTHTGPRPVRAKLIGPLAAWFTLATLTMTAGGSS